MSVVRSWTEWHQHEKAALLLRVGLGIVFVSGGLAKLVKLLDPAAQSSLVTAYIGAGGYVNAFFADFLFSTGLTPWVFLTGLSTFEALGGAALLVGLAVRPLSLIYGFLMWSFVMALPVTLTPGVALGVKTYTSPAMLVLARDIAMSGLLFALFNLGSGPLSLDRRLFNLPAFREGTSWEHLGLLIRLSLAYVFVVAGIFRGMDHIQSFGTTPFILVPLGIVLATGFGARVAGLIGLGLIAIYAVGQLSLDKGVIGNFNGIKREFALFAAGMTLALFGGGKLFTPGKLIERIGTLTRPARSISS